MKASHIIAIVVSVVAVLWIISGVILPTPQAEESAQATQEETTEKALMQVRVRDLTAQSYLDKIELTGRTHASRSVDLRAEISGQINALHKEEGDQISDEEKLAELEVLDRDARVTEARERVNQRQIEYNAAKKLANKGFNSKVRLAQALADLENAKAALKQSQVDLGKIVITAPFEGVIAKQDVEMGDYLSVGNPLFTIVDLDPIELVGFVSEKNIQDLQTGSSASAEFLNGDILEGTVSYISPVADPDTRTFRIIMSAPNTELKYKDGLTAKMIVPIAERMAHRISPSILTLNDAGQVGVKIVNANDIVEFIPVTILADTADAMWIVGPPDSARFITVGQDFVAEGQKVEAVLADGEGLL